MYICSPVSSAQKGVSNGKTLRWRAATCSHAQQIHSVHVAQLTVDMLQDLRVGLVFGRVATQRALRKEDRKMYTSGHLLEGV